MIAKQHYRSEFVATPIHNVAWPGVYWMGDDIGTSIVITSTSNAAGKLSD